MSPDLTPAPSSPRQASAREFFAVVFRRKWLILGLFTITTATAVVIAATTPVEYVSSGRVLFKRGEQVSALDPTRQAFSDWEEDMGSELEVVKSSPVLQRTREILAERALKGGRLYELHHDQVDVEVKGRSNVILIGYHDLDPEAAQHVCAALIDAYVDYRQNVVSEAHPRQFFGAEIERTRAQLDSLTERRRQFATRLGLVDVEVQQGAMVGQLQLLDQRRGEIEADLAEARAAQHAMLELKDQPDIDLPTLGQQYTNESALVEIKRKVLDQEARLAELRERYREESPEVTAALTTLETLRGMLRREVDARLKLSESRIAMLQARLGILTREYDKYQTRFDAMPAKESQLAVLDRDIAVLKTRYGDLEGFLARAKMTQSTSPLFTVLLLSPAGAAAPLNTRDYVRLALAPAFSLVVGIGLAFFIDGLDLTVRTAGHAEDALELPVLAALPERRKRA